MQLQLQLQLHMHLHLQPLMRPRAVELWMLVLATSKTATGGDKVYGLHAVGSFAYTIFRYRYLSTSTASKKDELHQDSTKDPPVLSIITKHERTLWS